MNIGLVFEGGGGKGAYQIGVWNALRTLAIEKHITAVAGTSVGALNGALFWKGSLDAAEGLWSEISGSQILKQKTPIDEEDSVFSNKGLEQFVQRALNIQPSTKRLFYATCKDAKSGELKYFPVHTMIDPGYQRKVLLASSAIPGVFPSIEIDGREYCDGGANGDNTPVFPIYENGIRTIIVVHLKEDRSVFRPNYPGARIIEVTPSQSLGGVTGTLDFNAKRARERYELGYRDGMIQLAALSNELYDERNIPVENRGKEPQTEYQQSTPKMNGRERDTMEKIRFNQPSVNQEYEKRIEQLKRIAHADGVTPKIMWDETAARYARTIYQVNELLKQEEVQDNITERLNNQIQTFLNKCATPEFHIALVGAIKAGKSSLINAILDDELASTEVTPETAALTKFRGSSDRDYVRISFYSAAEWKKLWESASKVKESKFLSEYEQLNAQDERDNWVGHAPMRESCATKEELKQVIKKWTSSQSATHYFVKEVEVGLKEFALPEGVILVDTPGLNDAVAYRSDITKNYIDRANAVLVCVKSDSLSAPELNTIYGVFSNARYNPEKVYIVATQQDTLNDPIEDWKKQSRVWGGYLKEKACYGSVELTQKNLISTSGYFYTLLRKEDLDKKRKFQLMSSAMKLECGPEEISERYEELLEFTGIERLRRKLDEEIVSRHKELLREDLASGYESVKESITSILQQVADRQRELIEISKKDQEAIQAAREENQKKLEERKKDQEELEELTEEIKKQTKERKQKLLEAIRGLGGK